MKIAITAQGQDLQSAVDPRFGRAKWFLVVDTETGDCEAVDNKQNVNAAQGAGIQAAKIVASKQVEALITGHCGPNAFHTLNAAGIKIIVGAEGTVSEALEKYKNGELKPVEGPDVAGHWV
jgi:predicted Fe-Mo cluster-binding NifX family protein